ncbi:hypothetical protein EMCG_08057 [[Emmonsia] crescens]|uniref:Uncharacterized protein n=1 Tax=[Emmonsia] crescens TaxID=73230 RepID=A0A0G2JAS1_9EURO|nr:hypothetical protein EMCG_08057 [Emmonsia crescens UAMH 3008]
MATCVSAIRTMYKHWQTQHSWTPCPGRGRVCPQKRMQAQDEIHRSCQKVQYQQVFPSRKGSHYISIQPDKGAEDIPIPDQNTASQAIDKLEQFYQEQQQQATNVIQAGERDEANP